MSSISQETKRVFDGLSLLQGKPTCDVDFSLLFYFTYNFFFYIQTTKKMIHINIIIILINSHYCSISAIFINKKLVQTI